LLNYLKLRTVRKTLCAVVLCLVGWIQGYSQTPSRVMISSITPSVSTGQDYSSWLSDDLSRLVPDVWAHVNMQYIDVKLKLQAKTNVTKVSLYDYTGVFTSTPAYVYSVNGTTRTLIGTFTGALYMAWVDLAPATALLTDTIVIRKYGNCIPQKVNIYGTPAGLSTPITGYAISCVGGTTSLGNATWGGAWVSGNTAVATINSGTGVVTGVSAGTATITYTITGLSATTVVTVNPAASAGSISGTATACPGGTMALSASGSAGGTWSSSATGVATVSSSGVVTGVSAGTTTISYSVSNSCGTSASTKVVTVNAVPGSVSVIGTGSVCAGGSTTMSGSVSGGTWTSSAPTVATVSTAGIVTGVAAGSAIISYSVSGSCGSAVATKSVTVNTAPVTGSLSGTGVMCPGATAALSVTGGVSGGSWSSAAPAVASVSTTGVVTGVAAGTANISYSVAGSCGTVAATKSVTVNSMASAGTITGTTSVSAGSATTLADAVSGGTWSCASTSVATVNSAGSVSGVSAGTATISYTVSNSCGSASATQAVTVTTGTTGSTGSSGLVRCKIPIDPKRWYQLDNTSNGIGGLFDGVLSTAVGTGWGKILTNYDAYYPVLPGETINIDSIRFYDGSGSNQSTPFTLYYIDSLWNRVRIASFIGTQYNTWVGPDTSHQSNFSLSIPASNVRYLLINCSGAYPNEMELYGSYAAPSAPPAVAAKTIKLKQELGVNGFEWNFENPSSPLVIDESRMAAAKSFAGLRHYLDWEKLEPTSGGYTYNPSHSGGWNLDTMYARCKAEGIEVLADIKTLPGWMQSTYPSGADAENVPVPYGSNFSTPASYIKQAKVGFQFAARYGRSTTVSSSLLSVDASTRWTGDPANTVRTGLDYVKYVECDNERDKWWKGRNAYQTGREYAANLSAFYDGNKNTMGPGVGVKNADPTMMVVMGGVACPTTDYLRGMIDWCKEFRGYKSDGSVNLCWDVINYHIYPDNNGSMQGTGTRGAAPEVAHADTFASNFINAAHTYAADMPVWITETGYDINTGSVLKAIPIGAKSALQTQADWILRTSLLNARMGIERTFFYEMYDDDVTSATKFSSSGLINADKTRKPAADYLMQANKLMGDYEYKETISTNPMVDRYELAGQSIYVLVNPTESGATASYSLPLATAGSARIYTPVAGQDTMSVTSASVSGGHLSLTVTETPVFVMPGGSSGGARENAEPAVEPTNALQESSIVVYPNPTTGNFRFSIDNDKQTDINIAIYSSSGRLCKSYQFNKTPGKYIQAVDISSLPNGLYFMEIGQGSDRVTKKVIKINQ
jgi:endoglucanase